MKVVTVCLLLSSLGLAYGQTVGLLIPHGPTNGDASLYRNDDGYSDAISLVNEFPYFGQSYQDIFVSTNGILSFGAGVSSFTPTEFPVSTNPVLAAFWGDIDIRYSGFVYYREVTEDAESGLLAELSDVIVAHFGPRRQAPSDFTATSGFITTWLDVPAYPGSGSETNTFQAVLVTDGAYSFVLYNYERITWVAGSASEVPAQVGFDAGDGINFFAVPSSRNADIANIDDQSNIGEPLGRWMFRVDLNEIVDGGSEPVCGDPDSPGGCGPNEIYNEVEDTCESFAPEVTACPLMTGPTILHELTNHFKFTCEFSFEVDESRTASDYGFLVQWLFNGDESATPVSASPAFDALGTISVDLLHTDLVGSDHLGKWLSCSVKTYWTDTPTEFSEEMRTGGYWIGVKAVYETENGFEDLYHLTLDEADDEPQNVYLVSTLPVIRDGGDEDHRFMIYSPNSLTRTYQDLGFNCSYDMRAQDWIADGTDSVLGESNVSFNPDYPLVVRTIVTATTESMMIDFIEFEYDEADADNIPSYWQGYAPPSITVYRYNDQEMLPSTCISSGDPHQTTFDGTSFNMVQTGRFVLARSSSRRGFEVQYSTFPCDRAGGSIVSCVCGVAMREDQEVYYATMCNNNRRFRDGLVWHGTEDQNATRFTRITDYSGHEHSVTTPEGANLRIYVYDWGMNVYLTVIGADYDRMEGICGTFNGDSRDDLQYRDSTQVADTEDPADVADFSMSWKLTGREEDLFDPDYEVPIEPTEASAITEDRYKYCTCLHPDEDENDDRCVVPVNEAGPPLLGGGFTNPINLFGSSSTVASTNTGGFSPFLPFGRRRRSVDDEEVDFGAGIDEPVYGENTFPTPSNITEAEARAYCEQTLTGGCGETTIDDDVLQGIISNCMQDVRDLDSLESVSDVFIGQSQFECIISVIQVVNNQTNENSTLAEVVAAVDDLLGPVVTSLCTADCSGHGVCADSTCTCNEGYVGSICDIDEDSLPDVESFTYGDVCDSDVEDCSTVSVITSNIFHTDTLACKIMYEGDEYIYSALLRSFAEVDCDLPDILIGTTNQIDLEISLTRDGENYGDSAAYRIYSGTCLECASATDDCSVVTDMCSVSGVCYNTGSRYPAALCFLCDPTNDQWQFTEEADCDSDEAGVGEWQDWGDYSDCSESCDYGWETRDRSCYVADTCLVGNATESQICIDFRCVEVTDEINNNVLMVIQGSSNDVIGTLLNNDESMRSVIATKLNNYCVDNPGDCCDLVGVSPSSPSMSVFTAEEVDIAAGTMIPDTDEDTISMRLYAKIEQATLTSACAGGSRRRRRDATYVYLPADIMETAAEDSISAFASLNVIVVSVGEIISDLSDEDDDDDEDGGSGSGGIGAAIIGIAIGCVLAAIVLIVIIGIVIHQKSKKNTPVQPMVGHSNPAMATQDEMAMQYKHKFISVAPPPTYDEMYMTPGQAAPLAAPTYSKA